MAGKLVVAVAGIAVAVAIGFVGGGSLGGGADVGMAREVAALARRVEALERGQGVEESRRSGSETASEEPARAVGVSASAATPADAASSTIFDERLAEQERRMATLERDLAATVERTAALNLWAAGMGPAPRDATVELNRFMELATPALLRELKRLSRSPRQRTPEGQATQVERVLAACDVLLSRELEPLQRAEVLTAKGIAHRTDRAFDGAEAELREAVAIAGRSSEQGVDATVHLAFVKVFRKEFTAAGDLFLGVYRLTSEAADVRARSRRLAGVNFGIDDPARGLEELRGVVDEFGASDDDHVRAEVEQARKAIEQLEGAVR